MIGAASGVYEDWRCKLLGILAHVEAAVDFSEEEGVSEAALAHVGRDVAGLVGAMSAALGQAERAREVADGVRVVLAGLPNTGKSSLLNTLARREAAIVSSKPGTTRDVIEVVLEIEGMAVVLSDTAGLRLDASDEIELIGIGKTKAELGKADIVLWVAAPDVSGSVVPEEGVTPDMLILNKADLSEFDSHPFRIDPRVIQISAMTGQGIERVIAALAALIIENYGENHHPVIVRERQKQAIIESIRHLNDSLTHDVNHLELTAEDLRKAANCLARVTGRIDVEDLLSAIFSEFCIGK